MVRSLGREPWIGPLFLLRSELPTELFALFRGQALKFFQNRRPLFGSNPFSSIVYRLPSIVCSERFQIFFTLSV